VYSTGPLQEASPSCILRTKSPDACPTPRARCTRSMCSAPESAGWKGRGPTSLISGKGGSQVTRYPSPSRPTSLVSREGGSRITCQRSHESGGWGLPVALVAVAVRVIKIISGITITRVVWIRLPIGDRLVRLGSWRSGGSAVTVQEVTSAEDANRELPASGVSQHSVCGDRGG
jgi:hypothetical protein